MQPCYVLSGYWHLVKLQNLGGIFVSGLQDKSFMNGSFLFSYISKEILTIREAVWLTDNTYKYEDLVRMMGEVVAVLEGNIRVRTPTKPPCCDRFISFSFPLFKC